MVDPAILEAEFQRPHIAGRDQLARFHAQIGGDALDDLIALAHRHAAGGAKGELVGSKGRAGEPESQGGGLGEASEGMPPGGGLRLLGVEAQMVHLIGNGEPGVRAPALEGVLEELAMAGCVGRVVRHPRYRQPQPGGRAAPLGGDRAAVAKDHKAVQSLLLLQPLKAQQGTQGFSGSGSGVDQHVVAAGLGA